MSVVERAETITDPVGDTPGARAIGFEAAAHRNASEILFANLSRDPGAVALTFPGGTLSYAQLCAEASRWGDALAAERLARGERVALLLDDTPAYVAAFMGAVRAGFVPVLVNTQTSAELLRYFLSDSGARVAVCGAEFAHLFAGVELTRLVVVGGEDADDARFLDGRAQQLAAADTRPDDMAFFMYSSGSTGRPKGIVHLQHDMAYTAMSYAAHILGLTPADRCYSVPKLFFAYGFGNAITFPFAAGASALLMPGRPEPSRVLGAIEEHRPTVLFGLPTLYSALCRAPGVAERDLSSLRLAISAAEVLSKDVFDAWAGLTGLQPIEGLGSTEMLHIYLSNTAEEKRHGAAGRVVPGYEVKLCDPDGAPVPPGEEGVMWARGHSSAPAYWQRPDKTAETMRGDWIYTGDRFVERDGFYYFQGRADDLIKVSGQWVWPLEVERCLAEHADVAACAVLAEELADRRMGLRAVVQLCDGVAPDEATTLRLREHVKAALLPYKAPRRFDYVAALPHTGTGKIDRQALAAAGGGG